MVAVAPRETGGQANQTQVVGLNGWLGGLNWSSEFAHVRLDELLDCVNLDIKPDGGLAARKRWTHGRDLSSHMDSSGNGSSWLPRNAGMIRLQFRDVMWQAFPNQDDPFLIESRLFVLGQEGDGTWSEGVARYSDDSNAVRGETPAGFDGAQWDFQYYFATGIERASGAGGGQPVKFNQADILAFDPLTAVAEGNGFNNDYRGGGDGDFPRTNTIASHMGYMFAGGVRNDSGDPMWNRLRWSHPGNPEAWAQKDWIDIREGGEQITHIESLDDQLVIFKDRSIWSLRGYSPSTWELQEVTREMGAFSSMGVTQGGGAILFANDFGVWRYNNDGSISELSVKISNFFRGGNIPGAQDPFEKYDIDADEDRFRHVVGPWPGTAPLRDTADRHMRYVVSWVNDRLWVSVNATFPMWQTQNGGVGFDWEGGNTYPYPITLVFDPNVGEGVWTTYVGHNYNCPGRVVRFHDFNMDHPDVPGTTGGDRWVGFSSQKPLALVVEAESTFPEIRWTSTDLTPTDEMAYWFMSPWIHGGNPGLKKRFRRTDVAVTSAAFELDTTAGELLSTGLDWFTYDDMSLYAPDKTGRLTPTFELWGNTTDGFFAVPTTDVQETTSLGSRKAVAFSMVAYGSFDRDQFAQGHLGTLMSSTRSLNPGHELAVSSLTFKFVPRRLI